MDRRQVLLLLASASSSAIAADKAAPPAEPAPKEKVLGIGGLFFRANDPGALGQWYRDNLGINLTPSRRKSGRVVATEGAPAHDLIWKRLAMR
jgi:glyoxylase I family protein